MRYILRARWNGEGTAFEYCETEEKRCWEKRDENFEINIEFKTQKVLNLFLPMKNR